MSSSTQIRAAFTRVSELRAMANASPDLLMAVDSIKAFQAQRFMGTYADLLNNPIYAECANFFLHELYGCKDFKERDAQFARIAGAMEITFPPKVTDLAVVLAQLHCVTEDLDVLMARCWAQSPELAFETRYRHAWRAVGQRDQREWQLATVIGIGKTLCELTRKRSIGLLLKIMRRPAELAGLGSLQIFLETGFDGFGKLSKNKKSVETFLNTIHERESNWMNSLG